MKSYNINHTQTIYFYSIATDEQDWSSEKQYSVCFKSWPDFASFCQSIAVSQETTVRGCTTSGTNNQGYYFLGR